MKLGNNPNDPDAKIFVIERLGRGSIINHISFLPQVADKSDTEFKCKTSVSALLLRTDVIKHIVAKRADLKDALQETYDRINGKQIALDYIIHNNAPKETYAQTLEQNAMRVRLKNAIMQIWSQYKQDNKKPSLNDLVKNLMKEKKERDRKGKETEQQEIERLRQEQKRAQREQRKAEEKAKLSEEARNSYLRLEQYEYIVDNAKFFKHRLQK